MGDALSKKQKEIYDYIVAVQAAKGYPPSVREICEAVNLQSTSTVHGHLNRLERKGYIRRDPSKPRALEILLNADGEPMVRHQEAASNVVAFQGPGTPELVAVPILGKVTAGEPILWPWKILKIIFRFPWIMHIIPMFSCCTYRVRA